MIPSRRIQGCDLNQWHTPGKLHPLKALGGGGGGVTENGENNSCIHPWFQAQTQKLKKNFKSTSKN